jgi:LPXTG-motif cell wall-anchored protein
MVKKLVALSAVLLLAMAGPAHAGDGYADEDTATVSDSTVTPGQSVTVTGEVFQPGSSVTFSLSGSVLGSATANQAGVASLTFEVPGLDAGTYTVEVSGTGADGLPLTVSTTFEVLAAGSGAGDLPTTGSSGTVSMTQIAVAALAGGGLLVLLANKRRTAKADTADLTSV